MNKTDPHTQTNHRQITAAEINEMHMPKIDLVLRTLLLNHKIKPYELAMFLNIPHQTISQLLLKKAIHPRISTLIPIAKFFNITIGQLIGHEPLDVEQKSEDEELAPGVWNSELFMQCTQCVIQLLEKYNTPPNEKIAAKLICQRLRLFITSYASSIRRGVT